MKGPFIGIATLTLASAALAQPTGQIAYQTFVADGNTDIYIMDMDSRISHRLAVPELGIEASPQFSRDGRWITFNGGPSGQSAIRLCRSNGTSLVTLTSTGDAVEPDFSPDASQIVFHNVYGNIFTVSTAGGTPIDTGVHGGHTRWNPTTGSRAVLNTDWPGGTTMSVLDTGSSVNTPLLSDCIRADWSWDGTRIVYISPVFGGSADVFISDADGSNPRNLTNTPGIAEGMGSFSPDGAYVCFSRPDPDAENRSDLWIVRIDGTGLENITNTPNVSEYATSWAQSPTCNLDLNSDGNTDQDDVVFLINSIAGGGCL